MEKLKKLEFEIKERLSHKYKLQKRIKQTAKTISSLNSSQVIEKTQKFGDSPKHNNNNQSVHLAEREEDLEEQLFRKVVNECITKREPISFIR
jgi:predicted DsbA family dithiol-disulfide isomerase